MEYIENVKNWNIGTVYKNEKKKIKRFFYFLTFFKEFKFIFNSILDIKEVVKVIFTMLQGK